MNKWQVYCPVLALLAIAIVWTLHQGRVQRRRYVSARTQTIAYQLLGAAHSPYLHHGPATLLRQLEILSLRPAGIQSHALGDTEAPIGNQEACSHFVLTNAIGQELGVRLKPSGKDFEVLGYWTNWQ